MELLDQGYNNFRAKVEKMDMCYFLKLCLFEKRYVYLLVLIYSSSVTSDVVHFLVAF